MKEEAAKAEVQSPAVAGSPVERVPASYPLLALQRQAGNRAVGSLIRAGRQALPGRGASGPPAGHRPTVQRDPVPPAALPPTKSWESVYQQLITMDETTVTTELRKYPHPDLIDFATYVYSTARPPGGRSASIMLTALQRFDSEATRIGQLNANYASAYREQRWPDIVRLLNGYATDDIVLRVASWNQYELHEGIFQAQQMFGPVASVHVTGPMLSRVPPPPVGPGTGPQLVAAGVEAGKQAVTALGSSAPCTVNAGAMGDVTLVPGATAGGKLLVSATQTGVYYTQGSSLYQMWAPDFVRDMWLNGISEGARRAEGMVRLAKLEFEILIALFVPWWGVALLGALEAIQAADANRPQIAKLREAIPKFSTQRAEFKQRYPTFYDKFFWHCLGEVVTHIPEGVQVEDVAYMLGRIAGTQGLSGAFAKALKTGTVVTAKTIAKIVAEYVILVSLLHAPGIAGRAAKAAARDTAAMAKAAAETQKGLGDIGIDVSMDEAKTIAAEIVEAGDPTELLQGLQQSTQDMADAFGVLQEYWEVHAL